MKFLFPDFLFALSALAIPIIIHLFNFRKFKKVYFPNVKFLKEVKQKTQARSKLKHWLVLASRMLAITFLVFAFAQPYIPDTSKKDVMGQQVVSVYIDNSFSMNSVGENGRLFDLAKQYAYEIANAYSQSDLFQLLTNDFEGRHQRFYNREDFIEMVDQVDISPSARSLSEVVSRQQDLMKEKSSNGKTSFIVSDFQKSFFDIENLTIDSNTAIKFISLESQNQENLLIDSCWFENPIRQLQVAQELSVRIKNNANKSYQNVPVKLIINGTQKALASFNLDPYETIDTVLTFTLAAPGIQQAEVAITDYPVTFDDHYYFSFTIAKKINVLAIQEEDTNTFIQSLFKNDPYFQVDHTKESQLNYSTLKDYKLIVVSSLERISSGLSNELNKFTSGGGHLLVFPAKKIDYNSYRDFLSSLGADAYLQLDTIRTDVSSINIEHSIYKDVFESVPENIDLPKVRKHHKIDTPVRSNREKLLSLSNGNIFLARYASRKGAVYLSASPIDSESSNFSRHAIFVPTLYNIAIQSQRSDQLAYTISKDEIIEQAYIPASNEQVFHITSTLLETDIIPEYRVINNQTVFFVHNQIKKGGNYLLQFGADKVNGLAFNYPRTESDLSIYSVEELNAAAEKIGGTSISLVDSDYRFISKTLNDISQGKRLWEICIILTLIFLGAEVLLLKFWS